MKKRSSFLNILLIAEAAVLILVVFFGVLLSRNPSGGTKRLSDEVGDGSEENSLTLVREVSLDFSEEVTQKLNEMTLEERVAQLFVTTPEELTGTDRVVAAEETTQETLLALPVGGLIYGEANLVDEEQIKQMLTHVQSFSQEAVGVDLFLLIEEAGGEEHSPLAAAVGREVLPSPATLGAEGNLSTIETLAQERASYVGSFGFNLLLAPIADTSADMSSDSDSGDANGEYDMKDFNSMTYGSDVYHVSECVQADIFGVLSTDVEAVLGDFPGRHEAAEEYIAYQAGIDADVSFIRVSSLPCEDLTGDEALPCCLSEAVAAYLKDEMGFTGILMTADLAGEDIAEQYTPTEAAVAALSAGMELLVVSDGLNEAYEAILSAVEEGTITEKTINNAAGKILTMKMR